MRLSKFTTEDLKGLADDFREADDDQTAEIIEEVANRRLAADSELAQLERSIAYVAAVSTVECNVPGAGLGQPEWFDVSRAGAEAKDAVDECVRYLDLRGLIERDATNPNWIAMRDESEAS